MKIYIRALRLLLNMAVLPFLVPTLLQGADNDSDLIDEYLRGEAAREAMKAADIKFCKMKLDNFSTDGQTDSSETASGEFPSSSYVSPTPDKRDLDGEYSPTATVASTALTGGTPTSSPAASPPRPTDGSQRIDVGAVARRLQDSTNQPLSVFCVPRSQSTPPSLTPDEDHPSGSALRPHFSPLGTPRALRPPLSPVEVGGPRRLGSCEGVRRLTPLLTFPKLPVGGIFGVTYPDMLFRLAISTQQLIKYPKIATETDDFLSGIVLNKDGTYPPKVARLAGLLNARVDIDVIATEFKGTVLAEIAGHVRTNNFFLLTAALIKLYSQMLGLAIVPYATDSYGFYPVRACHLTAITYRVCELCFEKSTELPVGSGRMTINDVWDSYCGQSDVVGSITRVNDSDSMLKEHTDRWTALEKSSIREEVQEPVLYDSRFFYSKYVSDGLLDCRWIRSADERLEAARDDLRIDFAEMSARRWCAHVMRWRNAGEDPNNLEGLMWMYNGFW